MLVFQIGGEEAEYVRVSNIGDHGDGWFSADVAVAVGSFEGRYRADLNSRAFSDFAAQLGQLYKTVSGSARFTSYEAQLELELVCNDLGHIKVRGEAMDYAGTGNRLTFHLDIDQTHVPAILSSLRQALERDPPRAV